MAGSRYREYGATVAKWRLSRRLIAMRERIGVSTAHAEAKLHWERGRLQRIQGNQWTLPHISTVRDLLRFYEASDEEQEEAIELTLHARTRLWWREYRGGSTDENRIFDNEFPGFENDAARISIYQPLMIPGLLQTPAYMEALLQADLKPPAWRQRAIEALLHRQQILERTDGTAPWLTAVITEAALMYHVGSQADRRDQIVHLAKMSRRPDVDVRLILFQDGPHPAMCGPISILEFPDAEEPRLIYRETGTAIQEMNKPADIRECAEAFTSVSHGALAHGTATAYLEKLAETLE